MVEEKLTKLTYIGENPLKFYIIKTRRTVTVKKGDVISVNKEELAEIKKARFRNFIKELKESKQVKGGEE